LCHAVEQAHPKHACWVVLLAELQQLVKFGVQWGHGALEVAEGAVRIFALQTQDSAGHVISASAHASAQCLECMHAAVHGITVMAMALEGNLLHAATY
jgi:hypothetical protein